MHFKQKLCLWEMGYGVVNIPLWETSFQETTKTTWSRNIFTFGTMFEEITCSKWLQNPCNWKKGKIFNLQPKTALDEWKQIYNQWR